MLRIELKDDEISAALARIAAAMTDMTPVMQDIGEALVISTQDRFTESVSPDGTAFAPRSPTTLDAYKARGDVVDFRPLIGPSKALSGTIFPHAGADFVEVGSGREYAAVMQFGAAKGAFGRTKRGAPIPWGNIPARPFLGLSEQDRLNIVDVVEEWLEGVAKGGST